MPAKLTNNLRLSSVSPMYENVFSTDIHQVVAANNAPESKIVLNFSSFSHKVANFQFLKSIFKQHFAKIWICYVAITGSVKSRTRTVYSLEFSYYTFLVQLWSMCQLTNLFIWGFLVWRTSEIFLPWRLRTDLQVKEELLDITVNYLILKLFQIWSEKYLDKLVKSWLTEWLSISFKLRKSNKLKPLTTEDKPTPFLSRRSKVENIFTKTSIYNMKSSLNAGWILLPILSIMIRILVCRRS